MDGLGERLRRKLEKYQLRYYYKAHPHNINPIKYLRLIREARMIAELKQHPELYRLLNRVIAQSDSTGCGYGDYAAQYQTVTRLEPECILECGSGISSCVIAFALKERFERTGFKARFVSMEENKFYYEQIVRIFPEELAEFVEFVRSDRVEHWYGDYRRYQGCHYADVPKLPYDFVFIDGPKHRDSPDAQKCFDADFIDVLLASNREVRGLLDQRIATYRTFKELIPGAAIRYNPIEKLTRIDAADRSALRKDLLLDD